MQLTEQVAAVVVWQACRRLHLRLSPLKRFMIASLQRVPSLGSLFRMWRQSSCLVLVWALVRRSSLHLQAFEPGHCWVQMPKDWALILQGGKGDLTEFGVRDLNFAQAPGHCSGHVVYSHKPSGYMLAGDFTDIIQGEDGSYKMHTMCNKSTCNITLAHETICRWVKSPFQLMQSKWFGHQGTLGTL